MEGGDLHDSIIIFVKSSIIFFISLVLPVFHFVYAVDLNAFLLGVHFYSEMMALRW
jgi:hypothetical protein